MPWTGYGFDENAYQQSQGQQQESGGSPDIYLNRRFFIKEKQEKTVIFTSNLREGCYKFAEHMAWDTLLGRPFFLPCLRYAPKPGKCYPCEQGSIPSRVLMHTIIDCDGFAYKKGERAGQVVKNIKSLFVIPFKQIDLFIRKEKAVDGLKLYKFKVFRTSKQTSRLGDDYTPMKRVDLAEMQQEKIDVEPFDYKVILPISMTYEQQQQFAEEHPGAVFSAPSKRQDQSNKQQTSTPQKPESSPKTQGEQASPEEDINYSDEQTDGNAEFPPF